MPKNQKKKKLTPQQKKTRKQNKRRIKKVALNVASLAVGSDNVRLARSSGALVKRVYRSSMGIIPKDSVYLGKCAWRLLMSYVDPFSPEADGACIPSAAMDRTHKARCYARGIGTIGTAKFGFVAVAPCIANDRRSIYYTKSNFGLSNLSAPASDVLWADQATGGATYPASSVLSTPYAATIFNHNSGVDYVTTGAKGRVVSASIRVMYIGTADEQSGLTMAYNDPADLNILGDGHAAASNGNGYFDTGLMSMLSTDIETTKREATCVILPGDDLELDFVDSADTDINNVFPYAGENYYLDSANVKAGVATGVIAMTGVAGQQFMWEVVVHCEYKGPAITPTVLTMNDSDPTGLAIVREILARAKSEAASTNGRSFQSCVRKAMAKMRVHKSQNAHTVIS